MTVQLPFLPKSTIVPPTEERDIIQQYFVRLFEEVSYNVNSRDYTAFQIPVSTTATNLPILNTFGAYIICVYGVISSQPVKTVSLVKSTSSNAGVINVLGTQQGSGAWAGKDVTLTSTGTNFQIAHNLSGVVANFYIRLVGI